MLSVCTVVIYYFRTVKDVCSSVIIPPRGKSWNGRETGASGKWRQSGWQKKGRGEKSCFPSLPFPPPPSAIVSSFSARPSFQSTPWSAPGSLRMQCDRSVHSIQKILDQKTATCGLTVARLFFLGWNWHGWVWYSPKVAVTNIHIGSPLAIGDAQGTAESLLVG